MTPRAYAGLASVLTDLGKKFHIQPVIFEILAFELFHVKTVEPAVFEEIVAQRIVTAGNDARQQVVQIQLLHLYMVHHAAEKLVQQLFIDGAVKACFAYHFGQQLFPFLGGAVPGIKIANPLFGVVQQGVEQLFLFADVVEQALHPLQGQSTFLYRGQPFTQSQQLTPTELPEIVVLHNSAEEQFIE